MKSLRLLILLFSSINLLAQTDTLSKKEIELELKKNIPDSLRVQYLFKLSDRIGDQNIEESKAINFQVLAILNTMEDTNYKHTKMALIYDKLGVIERKTSNYEKALAYYLKGLAIKEEIKDSINIGRSYHNISMLFRFQKEYLKSKGYLKKAIDLRAKLNDSSKWATSLNMYGVLMSRLKKNDSALYYYNLAKTIYKDDLKIASVNTNIASLHSKNKDYNTARLIYHENILIFKKHKTSLHQSGALISLARIYRKLNQHETALSYIKNAELIAINNGYKKHLSRIYLESYKITRDQKEYKKALDYYRTYKKYQDSIYDIQKAKRITTLELNYNHQKEKFADSIQFAHEKQSIEFRVAAEQSKNKFYLTLLLLSITLTTSLSLWFYYRKKAAKNLINKQNLEKELLDERIKNTKFQSQKVIADKSMRLQYTEEFLSKIKGIFKNTTAIQNPELQMLISELQSQTKIERKLEILEKNHADEHMDFEKQLIKDFPMLSKSERETCSLMRLNLSLKEIMSIRNVSMPSIKSSRYRIRQKLSVPKGIELEHFIQNLFL